MIAVTQFFVMLLGDFFKSIIFSPSSFVVSGCRWGKISYWKISPNMVKYGIYDYLQAMPHSQPFGLFHGRLAPYKTAKINAPALLTSHAPFTALRAVSWTAGAE